MTSASQTRAKTAFFDHHAANWDSAAPADMPRRLQRVVALAGLQPGARVLDVGSGTGVLIPPILAAIGPDGEVLALDISAEMVAAGRAKPYGPRVRWLLCDAQRLALPSDRFDAVFCNAALPHFDHKEMALREMARVLRPGGVLVVSHPIGREAVNRIHREAGGAVAGDRVPPPGRLIPWLRQAGLTAVRVVDEPEFYLALGRKPSPRRRTP